jgi:NhaA family Na+:H+ antiporter
MATDVAFAIALLSLLGPRVPAGLRAFLLTLAVVDDIGTIGVIALFYSSDIATTPLLIAAAGLLLVLGMRGAGVRSFLPYWVLGAAIWLAMEKSGVHPTVAGVALGLLTPLSLPTHQQTQRERAADRIPHLLRGQDTPTREFQQALDTVRRGAFAPLDTLRFRLEPWVLYLIMPLFALANAGVEISGVALLMQDELAIFAGVGAGLILGKPLGIVACAWLAAWLLKARLPDGTGWLSLAGAAWLAGVGFTVALFLTSLAFERPEAVAAARLGVLAGSFAAAAIGLTLLWKVLPSPKPAATSSRQHR